MNYKVCVNVDTFEIIVDSTTPENCGKYYHGCSTFHGYECIDNTRSKSIKNLIKICSQDIEDLSKMIKIKKSNLKKLKDELKSGDSNE